MHLRILDDQPSGEFGARVFHVIFGALCVCAAIWMLFPISSFNPYAFFLPLLVGLGPLLVGLCGDRKTVLQLLIISGS
ncbi:MAG TPA: hypothetical protein PKN13_15260 [Accumulibacter sp.]|nr:hypothetical protein [Accumulibacter sp.]HMW18213.1 hypothetical protein [Accumulibacter sp.]HND80602.1 hypothetical protein [Accumulibacter sp.]HNI73917.1 hypothetical protein [Accumulibacter sp.]HNL14299.1 hypothetical protein [Accumulibacter sp.]